MRTHPSSMPVLSNESIETPTSAITVRTDPNTSPAGSDPPLAATTDPPPNSRANASAIWLRPLFATHAKNTRNGSPLTHNAPESTRPEQPIPQPRTLPCSTRSPTLEDVTVLVSRWKGLA